MSVEIPASGSIPDYLDLETLARKGQTATVAHFDRKLSERGGSMANVYLLSESAEQYAATLACMMTINLPETVRPSEEVFVKTAIRTGAMIGEYLLRPRAYELSIPRLLNRLEEGGQDEFAFVRYMVDGPTKYLASRITLFTLLDRYSESFSASALEIGKARNVAGLVLMQLEEQHYEAYIGSQAADFGDSLSSWDGDISTLLRGPSNNQD